MANEEKPAVAPKPSPADKIKALLARLPKVPRLEKKQMIVVGAVAVIGGGVGVVTVFRHGKKAPPPAPVEAPKPAPKPALVVSTPTAPAPEPEITPEQAAAELKAQREEEAAQRREEAAQRVAAQLKKDKAVEAACASEIGLLCHALQGNIRAARKCLERRGDDLTAPCKKALELPADAKGPSDSSK